MSRGSASMSRWGAGFVRMTGNVITATVTSTEGSAACAQHPQVTHVGGQSRSVLSWGSSNVHGSSVQTVFIPDTEKLSKQTMAASVNRRTSRL
jgi:hypothetical protein